MKKKTIEKVPYLTLTKKVGKDAKYVGVTAFKNIGHERHLFVEVYKNQDAEEIPIVRIVLTKKDFATYVTEDGEWTRQCVEKGQYWSTPLWSEVDDLRDNMQRAEKKNALYCEKDWDRIKSFCNGITQDEKRWWQRIDECQRRITAATKRKVAQRKYERRQAALRDRIRHTRELPKKKILNRADNAYFHNKHFLYYKKRGCWAQIACSKCGGVTDARWKAGVSYESQFQKWTQEPREGDYGKCPMCGAHGWYKCQGKTKGTHSEIIHLFLGQKYKETGMVMRYVEVEKEWRLGLIATDKGEEMYNSCEALSVIEIARTYLEPGKEPQTDFHKYNHYSGKNFWDDCNLYGMNNVEIKEAQIMPETYEEMKGTIFQYSAMQEYVKEAYKIDPREYLERYVEIPQLEMIVKMGLIETAIYLVKYGNGIIENRYAKRPAEFLGIKAERVKQLVRKKGNISLLKVLQMEKQYGQQWTDKQIEHLIETGLSSQQIETAMEYMSLQQLLNRIEKYAGCTYETGCDTAVARIRHTATSYTDYLTMRVNLGYDLTNTVYQQPRDLSIAHERMVMESNKEEMDKHLQEAAAKYPNIRKSYEKLIERYYFEDDNYVIRPAESAEEIVMEGRLLHHCVGSAGYLDKHNKGVTYILMLRFEANPDIPYITIEIDSKEPRIIQWYGERDRKPDKKNMQQWLDGYLEKLKTGMLAAGQKIAIA